MMRSNISYRKYMQLVAYSKLTKKQKKYVDENMIPPYQRSYSGFGRITSYYKIDDLNKIISK
jgi:hypothetical protein